MNASLRVRVTTPWALNATRVPVELWITLGFSLFWLGCVVAGLPVSLPGLTEMPLLGVHFFFPIACAALGQLGFAVAASVVGGHRRPAIADVYTMLRLLPLFMISAFLYFNFKAWMPLVNPRLYDPLFHQIDQAAAPLLSMMLATRQAIAAYAPINADSWYMALFYAMFICSFLVHAIVDTPHRQRQLVLGLCLNLLLGGLSYWLMPAEGPFLYGAGSNWGATNLQWLMHDMFLNVRATGVLPPDYFMLPLGALPSLHVAHSLLLTMNAARSARFLLILYIPLLLWIILEASSAKWHYLIDLPAGVLLALLSYSIAQRLISADECAAHRSLPKGR